MGCVPYIYVINEGSRGMGDRRWLSYAKENFLHNYKTLCFLPNCYICGHSYQAMY